MLDIDLPSNDSRSLRFLWIELTNRCNLECVHCYADSGPNPPQADRLNVDDHLRLLSEAAQLGCRSVQFIGGEPTLDRGLPDLIARARQLGFEFVEVYTNGISLSDKLLDCFERHDVHVAVSVYADKADVHDEVTKREGSHRKTIRNLERMVAAGLTVRVGTIVMEQNEDRVQETMDFLKGLGIENVGVDRMRGVGRGARPAKVEPELHALCGECWKNSLCIGADGLVSPCIMSKAWAVGSVCESSLSELVAADRLRDVQQMIRDDVWRPREERLASSATCSPDVGCKPCDPVCNPCIPVCNPTAPVAASKSKKSERQSRHLG